LLAINAVSLVSALVANMSLLLNMARRIPFAVAQPITIIGFFVASFLLIGLVVASHVALRIDPPSEHAFSQAFYYAIMSAGIYFAIACLMCFTVLGAFRGHYSRDFKLTMSQRTLMLQTISFMVYLLAGAAVYAHIEGWKFLDAVYWADYTLLTIGIGDYGPETHLGRSLLFPFAIGGIVILGLVVGSIRSLVLERGKKKLGARMVEKKRERVLKTLDPDHKTPWGMRRIAKTMPDVHGAPRTSPEEELMRRQHEFHIMRKIQDRAARTRRWWSLCISGLAWMALWLVGAAVFTASEQSQNWSYFQSLYFAYTSLLTIGYGDFYPMSNSGKPFFVFWSLLAVPTMTVLISNMGDTVIKSIRDLTLFLGSFTVLPGETGVISGLKMYMHTFTHGHLFKEVSKEVDKQESTAPGFLGDIPMEEGKRDESPQEAEQPSQQAMAERNAEKDSPPPLNADGRWPHWRDEAHWHYLLTKEIAEVMKHINAEPPRKYTFHEWAWFLRLIGEDESAAATHRDPVTTRHPTRAKTSTFGIGSTRGKTNKDNSGQLRDINVADDQDTDTEKGLEGEDEDPKGKKSWSWLGPLSPLMTEQAESEWVLEKLVGALTQYAKIQNEEMRQKAVCKRGRSEGSEDRVKWDSSSSTDDDLKKRKSAQSDPTRTLSIDC
jgi:potassium channel subfamily K, other eukaryote